MEEKFALVIGSSSGLGLEIANYLLDEGFCVIGASRSNSNINRENFIELIVDIRDENSVIGLYNQTREITDGLHVIANTAGICAISSIEEMESSVFANHLETNILGPFHILKHGGEFIIPNETHIINISSVASQHAQENAGAYCSSKSALDSLIDSCRQEWKKRGARFSTLHPGAIDTPLWDKLGTNIVREDMIKIDEFIHVFDMIIKAPSSIQFSKIVFTHLNDYIETYTL